MIQKFNEIMANIINWSEKWEYFKYFYSAIELCWGLIFLCV